MWRLKLKETTYDKISGGHVLIIILGITVLAFLMLASVAGAVPFAYITNYDDNTTSVIDIATNTVTSTVPVGIRPCGVAVSPDGSKLYVTNAGDNTTSVIDTITNNVTVTVAVGKTPITLGQFIGGPVTASNTSRDTETDCKGIEDYVPDYAGGAVIHIKNRVGNDIVVSWAKEGSQKAVFQVNIPAGQTRTVTAPSGSYEEYIRAGCSWYIVTDGHIVVESGYEYSLEYYTVVDNNTIVYDGTGFKQIPDSQAPKI
jgi:YVTN family beta-propeller protein